MPWVESHALDPVDVRRSLAEQTFAFTVRAAEILLLDARYQHHGTDVTLAAAPGDQRIQQFLDIDTVGLDPASLAVDLQAGRLHDQTLDAALLEESCQPKPVVARLKTESYPRHMTGDLGQAIPRRIELSHQAFSVATPDRMQAWIIPARKLDRQKPTVLAQLKGTMESLFATGGRRGRHHSISLLLIAIETIEGS
jgi:hypothetical protein